MTGAIRGLFRAAVNALLCRSTGDAPQPQRRRRGETGKAAAAPFGAILHRLAKTGAAAARGRYAALQPAPRAAQERVTPAASAYDRVALYLADTLDWLTLWQDNAGHDHWLDEGFDTEQNQNFPQP
jgi:hypothetical protein